MRKWKQNKNIPVEPREDDFWLSNTVAKYFKWKLGKYDNRLDEKLHKSVNTRQVVFGSIHVKPVQAGEVHHGEGSQVSGQAG